MSPKPARPAPAKSRAAVATRITRQMSPRRAAVREDQPDRRLNILLAAEKLFAQHGFHGVSIRDIAAEAGVPLALVGYYFGAKHELYRAIFEAWSPMLQGRLDSLNAALTEPPASARLERIVDAFITPLLLLHEHADGRYYALMAARDLAAPSPEADQIHREFFDPLAHAFIDALMSVSPGATRGQVAWGYQFMLGALLHFMTDQRVERLSNGENRATDPAARGKLTTFLVAGLRALLGVKR